MCLVIKYVIHLEKWTFAWKAMCDVWWTPRNLLTSQDCHIFALRRKSHPSNICHIDGQIVQELGYMQLEHRMVFFQSSISCVIDMFTKSNLNFVPWSSDNFKKSKHSSDVSKLSKKVVFSTKSFPQFQRYTFLNALLHFNETPEYVPEH